MTNPFQGTLDGNELTETLRSLEAAGASGVLYVAREGSEKRIFFRQGRIVSVSLDAEEEELGQALVDRGRIEPEELEKAHRERSESGRSLPEVLADLALLSSSEIETTQADLERSALYSVLSWSEGEYRFEEGDSQTTPARLDVAPMDVVEESHHHLPARGNDLLEERRETPRLIRWAATVTPLADVTLSTKESALLDFLRSPSNQNLTAAEIVERSPLNDTETIQILSKLLASGVIEDREAERPSDLSSTRAGAVLSAESSWAGAPVSPLPQKLGRFVVEGTLGRGSMGAVLLAKDPAIDRTVAIKLIQTAGYLSSAQNEKYRDRFYREASAAGQLLHPNIATVFDVGHTDEGMPFIVMEYVKGRTLREVLESEPFSVADTMRLARDILQALGFAHSQGIVHRDVKPGNIMVTPEGHGKIMDFGIAHVVGSELTSAEDVLGSPYYMAPEQLSKGPIGPQTDLFAFAVVLYRMLTGVLPFTGESFAAIAHAILHESPAPPDLFSPQIPKALSQVVLRCLEKSPEDRYPSAEQVLGALADAEAGKEVSAAPAQSKAKLRLSFPRAGKRLYTLAALILLGLFAIVATQLSIDIDTGPNPAPSKQTRLPAQPSTPAASVPEGAGAGAATPTLPLPSSQSGPATVPNDQASSPSAPEPEPKPSQQAPKPTPRPRAPRELPPPVEAQPIETPSAEPPTPTVADLFYRARLALERGDLEEAKARLEVLLERDPTFAGGADLYTEVTDQIWERRLPIVIAARHNHRFGGCEGQLSLSTIGVRFNSEDHDWAFAREDIRVLERPDESTLIVETYEKDMLSLGKNKRYKFDLETPLAEDDWVRYQRLIK